MCDNHLALKEEIALGLSVKLLVCLFEILVRFVLGLMVKVF